MSSKRESDRVNRAKDILRGQSAPLAELEQLARALQTEKSVGYARKILQLACLYPELSQHPALRARLIQQHALCTYKDPDLPFERKFDRALIILQQLGDLRTTTDQETLGLAGALYKYKWEAFGQKQYLEQALAFYLRGYKLGVTADYGYTAKSVLPCQAVVFARRSFILASWRGLPNWTYCDMLRSSRAYLAARSSEPTIIWRCGNFCRRKKIRRSRETTI